jgi:puromycin-sensitive aminopeptidase
VPEPTDATSHRLPTHVLPHRYELELAPDLGAGTFTGTVSIEVEVREPTDTVTLHAVGLDITTAWARPDGGRPLDATVEADADHEMVRLQLPGTLPAGSAEVQLCFAGSLNHQLVGFYRSTFTAGGEEHAVAVTQFESTHARRAFPCFDEPEMKATFGIALVVPEGTMAVSNAEEVSRQPAGDGLDRVTFADTMRMSSYLVAFVVGALEVTATREVAGRNGPIPLRVLHPPGRGHLAGFALEVADAGLRFFEEWYDLPYPGDKVDLVAVPDFAFGAMENLGCITFREVLLLVDPDSATPRELQGVADVINHELAHMWFGDLVTMKWWNGIWLNEAFATFMELTASDAFRPDWDVWTTFGLARASAFDTDALHSTRPVEYDVVTAADAEGMFDVLTYEKGASVVRMLEQYLGPDRFRDGIRAYLRSHAFGNTETTDLWDALEEATGEPVRRVMDEWIFEGGHPLVEAHATAEGLRLSRRRALLSPAPPADDPSPDTAPGGEPPCPWPVPVVARLTGVRGGSWEQRLLLEDPVLLPTDAPLARAQLNVGGNGFYRTLLDPGLRTAIALHRGTPLERFCLLDDTWFAVLAGLVDPSGVRDVIDLTCPVEDDPSVWRRIATVADELRRLSPPARRPEVETWAAGVAAAGAERFPATETLSGRAAEVAGTVLALAGTTGASVIAREAAAELFERAGDSGAVLHPAIGAAALEVVAAAPTASEHAEIEHRWRTAATPQDEKRHLGALVAASDPVLFSAGMQLVLTEARSQDAPFVLRRALLHVERGADAWQKLADEWDDLLARLPGSAVPRMLEGIRGVTDPALAGRIRAHLTGHPLTTGRRQVRQHLERMDVTVEVARRFAA